MINLLWPITRPHTKEIKNETSSSLRQDFSTTDIFNSAHVCNLQTIYILIAPAARLSRGLQWQCSTKYKKMKASEITLDSSYERCTINLFFPNGTHIYLHTDHKLRVQEMCINNTHVECRAFIPVDNNGELKPKFFQLKYHYFFLQRKMRINGKNISRKELKPLFRAKNNVII
jgi:hypothetical protein